MKITKLSFISILAILAAIIVFPSCDSDSSEFDSSGEGRGGSMARFTFLKGYLYIVDENTLKHLISATLKTQIY